MNVFQFNSLPKESKWKAEHLLSSGAFVGDKYISGNPCGSHKFQYEIQNFLPGYHGGHLMGPFGGENEVVGNEGVYHHATEYNNLYDMREVSIVPIIGWVEARTLRTSVLAVKRSGSAPFPDRGKVKLLFESGIRGHYSSYCYVHRGVGHKVQGVQDDRTLRKITSDFEVLITCEHFDVILVTLCRFNKVDGSVEYFRAIKSFKLKKELNISKYGILTVLGIVIIPETSIIEGRTLFLQVLNHGGFVHPTGENLPNYKEISKRKNNYFLQVRDGELKKTFLKPIQIGVEYTASDIIPSPTTT